MIAVSVDEPAESRRVVEQQDLPFPILADTERDTVSAYGVLHAGGGPGGSDIALPAHFLIDTGGRIRWRFIARQAQDRPRPTRLLEVVRALD